MPDAEVQVVFQGASALPEDRFINTLHFSESAPLTFDVFADSIGPDIAEAFRTTVGDGNLFYPQDIVLRAFQVKVYNPDDAPPRQPRVYNATLPLSVGAAAPTEVAVVLSFYSTLNIPRRRGRIFLGPVTVNALGTGSLVNLPVRNKLQALANELGNVGPDSVDWQTFSRASGLRRRVTNAWVDNAFDTQRRRGLAATTRQTFIVQGGP